MRSIICAGGLTLLTASLAPCAWAEGAADASFAATTLDLSADGEVRVAPDMATITLGVTQRAPTAAEAMAATNDAMTKVIAAIKSAGIDARQIETSNLSLAPQYTYVPNEPQRLTGYQASNQVTVTVLELARIGPVADAVVAAGATNVGEISFGLRSRVPAENTARLAAVKALDDKAALYADATGYHVKRLISLSEGGFRAVPPPPIPFRQAQTLEAVPVTPVETGQLIVRITVTGEFELAH